MKLLVFLSLLTPVSLAWQSPARIRLSSTRLAAVDDLVKKTGGGLPLVTPGDRSLFDPSIGGKIKGSSVHERIRRGTEFPANRFRAIKAPPRVDYSYKIPVRAPRIFNRPEYAVPPQFASPMAYLDPSTMTGGDVDPSQYMMPQQIPSVAPVPAPAPSLTQEKAFDTALAFSSDTSPFPSGEAMQVSESIPISHISRSGHESFDSVTPTGAFAGFAPSYPQGEDVVHLTVPAPTNEVVHLTVPEPSNSQGMQVSDPVPMPATTNLGPPGQQQQQQMSAQQQAIQQQQVQQQLFDNPRGQVVHKQPGLEIRPDAMGLSHGSLMNR